MAAGAVVDAGDRVGGMSSWCYEEWGSSVVDNVLRLFVFLSFPSNSYFFAAVSHVLLFFQIINLYCLEFLHLSQTHSGHLPISWLVFLLFFENLVDMISPGFHSAAILVHLSGALGGDSQGLSSSVFQTCL